MTPITLQAEKKNVKKTWPPSDHVHKSLIERSCFLNYDVQQSHYSNKKELPQAVGIHAETQSLSLHSLSLPAEQQGNGSRLHQRCLESLSRRSFVTCDWALAALGLLR